MRRLLITFALTVAAVGVGVGVDVGVGVATIPVAALEDGFDDVFVASIAQPTAVEALPDGRVVVLEKDTGRVRLVDAATGAVQPTPALDLDVCSQSERGLLGFAVDPDIGMSGRVYVYYTRPASGFPGGCVNRVSAFRLSGDVIDPTSEQVLIDNISSVNGNHNGGDVEIGNDGHLYVAVGDAGRDPRGDSGRSGANDAAADRSILSGKILRLDRFTGAPAPGNPDTGPGTVACGSRGSLPSTPTSRCQEIFSYGLRNPFRFAFDPNTSATRFFINDVGQNTQEEVDEGRAGADYGWPSREGNCPQGQVPPCSGPAAGQVDPIVRYDHTLGTFITAGAFVPNGAWPEVFDGGYLFADGGTGRVWLRRADGVVDFAAPFTERRFGLADMAFVMEPTGYALYYTLSGGNELRKITWRAPESAPVPSARYVPNEVPQRAFDTREQSPPARLVGGTTRLVDLDAPAGATSALVNVTLIDPSGGAFVSAWEPRTRRPPTSSVNALAGQVVANSAIVPLDPDGRVQLFQRTTADVIVDVSGFFVTDQGGGIDGRFQATNPQRLVDTRLASAVGNEFEQVLVPGDSTPDGPSLVSRLRVPVVDRAGLPAVGVGAVVLVATGIDRPGGAPGFVRVAPSGSSSTTSSLNTAGAGDVRANLVVAAVGADGAVDVDLRNVGDMLLDVVGWFSNDQLATPVAGEGGLFQRIAPTREADTRVGLGFGPLGAEDTVQLDPISVPSSARAVAQNLLMAPSTGASFVTAFPAGDLPEVSNVNSTASGQFPGSAAITVLDRGSQSIFSLAPTDLVVDVVGYFR